LVGSNFVESKMPMPPTNQEARCLCRCLISCGLGTRLCLLVLASRFEGSLDAGVRWAAAAVGEGAAGAEVDAAIFASSDACASSVFDFNRVPWLRMTVESVLVATFTEAAFFDPFLAPFPFAMIVGAQN
jgi:hypothetical protein